MRKRFGKNDAVFIFLLIAVAIIVMIFFYTGKNQTGDEVIITVDGEVYGTYLLSENQMIEIKVDGKHTNTLTITDGYAKMTEADCPDKLCMHQNKISKDKENIVCLPNKIVVTVNSSKENDFDSMVR